MGDRLPLGLLEALTEAEAVEVREGVAVLVTEVLKVGRGRVERKEVGEVPEEGDTLGLAEVVKVGEAEVHPDGVRVTLLDWVKVGEEEWEGVVLAVEHWDREPEGECVGVAEALALELGEEDPVELPPVGVGVAKEVGEGRAPLAVACAEGLGGSEALAVALPVKVGGAREGVRVAVA